MSNKSFYPTGKGERFVAPSSSEVSPQPAYDINSATLRQLHFPYPSGEVMVLARASFREIERSYSAVFGYGDTGGGYKYKNYCMHRDTPTVAIATGSARSGYDQVKEKEKSPLDVLGRKKLAAMGIVWDDELLRRIFEPKTYHLFELADKLSPEKRQALGASFLAGGTPNTGGGEVDILLAPYFGGDGLVHRHLKRLSATCYRDFGRFMDASPAVQRSLVVSLLTHNVESMPNGRPNPQQLKVFVQGLVTQPDLADDDRVSIKELALEMLKSANNTQVNIFSSDSRS